MMTYGLLVSSRESRSGNQFRGGPGQGGAGRTFDPGRSVGLHKEESQ